MKEPSNPKEAHAAGLVWVNVDLNRGPKVNVARLKVVGAVSPALAQAIEHLTFGDVEEALAILKRVTE